MEGIGTSLMRLDEMEPFFFNLIGLYNDGIGEGSGYLHWIRVISTIPWLIDWVTFFLFSDGIVGKLPIFELILPFENYDTKSFINIAKSLSLL